jgi:hypothetical protein
MNTRAQLLGLATLITLTVPAPAQDIVTGPEKGKAVPALKVFAATGPEQGKELDYVAERKDKPTIYCLVAADQFDRPIARFLKKLDEALAKDDAQAYIVAVWLTEDSDKTREYLPKVQQSLQLQATALTCFGEKTGPKDWNVNADARLTVVVAYKQKVAATFGYNSVNETDVPAVREALKKASK